MIKFIFFFNIFFNFNLYADGFEGCGKYQFKGILREYKGAAFKMAYIVNEGTGSQMVFNLKTQENVYLLIPLLNKPSSFKGNILELMDGTLGAVDELSAISIRFPNPLSANDTGIKLIQPMKCKKK